MCIRWTVSVSISFDLWLMTVSSRQQEVELAKYVVFYCIVSFQIVSSIVKIILN